MCKTVLADSYSSLNSDLSSIEALGKLFPIIFTSRRAYEPTVALTRMVEEERGLIGTYKALGFGNTAIYSKYILFVYSLPTRRCFGRRIRLVFMPRFISTILDSLYSLQVLSAL